MNRKLKFSAVPLLSLAVCSAPLISFAEESTTAPKAEEGKIVAKVVPLVLTDQSGDFKMEVKDDDSLEIGGNTIAILGDHGEIFGTNANELAQLKADGKVVTKTGHEIGQVLKNGDFKMGDGTTVSWTKKSDEELPGKATVTLGDGDMVMTLEPDSAEARRWASVVLLLHFTAEAQ